MKKKVKLAVKNSSGNVGKSTLAKNMLLPRLLAEYFNVETINDNDSTEPKINAKKLDDLMDAVGVAESAIVDVGASLSEAFLHKMRALDGVHEDFTHFLVPCTEPFKQQRDTIATIESLAELGVPQSKIHVAFNNVDPDTNVEHAFNGIFEYHRQYKKFHIYPEAVIYSTSLFDKLRLEKIDMKDLLADERDFHMLRETAPTREEKLQWTVKLNLKRAATRVDLELAYFFNAMFSA